jgi:hypothetical protein
MAIKHAKTSAISDGGDSSLVLPSDWNADHTGINTHDHSDAANGGAVVSASLTAAGIAELATAAEVTAGSDEGRVVTPDKLAGSDYGKRFIDLQLIDDDTVLTTGDGKKHWFVPAEFNGWNLVGVAAMVSTVSSSGTPTYMVRNVTDSQDILSTPLTIDANEKTSYTAATAAVINTDYDDLATGDDIAIDKDVQGTGCKGDTVRLIVQAP